MDILLILKAVAMGLVEGATEFIPVSSTGHLILAKHFLNFQVGDEFEVVIQTGAILAICLLYFQKLWNTLIGLPKSAAARRFAVAVVVGFLPAAVLGLVLHDFIKAYLFSTTVVAVSLIVGGVLILVIEKMKLTPKVASVDDLSAVMALKIGLAQCLAMIPGVSRSGATIMGAMLFGVERKAATEFSFFLAIPTLIGAAVLDLYKGWEKFSSAELDLIGVGFIASFVSAIVVVKAFVAFVGRHDFTPFAWYRILAGLALFALAV